MIELSKAQRRRLAKHIIRLSKQDTLRLAALALTNEGSIPVHLVSSLVDMVTKEDYGRCLTAMTILQCVDLPKRDNDRLRPQVEAILRFDRDNTAKRFARATGHALGRGGIALFLGIAFTTLATSISGSGDSPLTPVKVIMLVIFGAIAGLFLFMALFTPIWSPLVDKSRSDRIRSQAALLLGRVGNVHSVIELAKVSREVGMQEASSVALLKLLPLVQEEHYPEISRSLTPALVGAFAYSNSQLLEQILLALERAGNGSAVAPVERLIKSNSSAKTKKVANRALVQLRIRQEAEQNAERLLRPTDAPGENLLRPAMNTDTPEEQLLRPITD